MILTQQEIEIYDDWKRRKNEYRRELYQRKKAEIQTTSEAKAETTTETAVDTAS